MNWTHVWPDPLQVNPALLLTLTDRSLPPRSDATDADARVSIRLKRRSLFAQSGCRTFCLPFFHATILAR